MLVTIQNHYPMLDNLIPKLYRPNKPGSGCGPPIARVCTIPAPPEGAIQLIGPCVKEGVGTAHKPAQHRRRTPTHDREEIVHTNVRKHC
ncbi:jg10290 [Pararge aegeria aegeria]|uniref:Jg10290 protein n=1 Tax=Pararge aegeria aegeria TaxID=348720 RepID=A0A8S4S7Y7_9NEOP|nr:jg10290 [Pararge aegeria aegeria]